MNILNYSIAGVLIFLMLIQIIMLIILVSKLDSINLFISSGTTFFIDMDNIIPKFERIINIIDKL